MSCKRKNKMGPVKYHFLDSGAYSLKNKYESKSIGMEFYDSPAFWEYIDGYAAFIKKYKDGIHFYANLDVIGNPELSYRNLKYLEKTHGLTPVPVIHFGSDLEWVKFYIKRYSFIGFGGLVLHTRHHSKKWLDACFDIICDTPDRLPKVNVHGFGVTSFAWLLRYPWWSVDSTSWARVAGLGSIYIPKHKGGKFVFNEAPIIYPISNESPSIKRKDQHYETLSVLEKEIIRKWLIQINIPLGDDDNIGVKNNSGCRRRANLLFFEKMIEELSKTPRPFILQRRSLI